MKTKLNQTLQGRLAMTFSLGQALALLELPQLELASWLLSEIEKNPLLELDALPRSLPLKGDIEGPKTVYDHLMQQIRERFSSPERQAEAIHLLENLDERGYLPASTPDGPTLIQLQTFDPPGIFARGLRECLLLQLERYSPPYRIVERCFDDLLHGRFKEVRQKTGIGDLRAAIQTLARLECRPSELFRQEPRIPIVADLTISKREKVWVITSNDDELPKFHLRADYLTLSSKSPDEQDLLGRWASSGKWLLRSLKRRKAILLEVGLLLVRKQAAFLEQKGDLQPLSTKELAEQLHLHESTLSRALAGKYANTSRGLLPLSSLLSSASEPAKMALQKLIRGEDKAKPFSDQEIVAELQKRGVRLARRTVAKYRAELKIGPASHRKSASYQRR